MSEAMSVYRRLEERLIWLRWVNMGHEAPEEEDLLDEITEAWMGLDDQEQKRIRQEGPKTLIAGTVSATSRHYLYEPLDTSGQHRVLKEVA